jgi:stringent starvation protein B
MTETSLSSTRPYLIRAMHEWMTDNAETPLIVVNAESEGVVVPAEHVADGRIVLNIAWAATQNLLMENDVITFQARFGGVPHAVSLPITAVIGLYARESGQGMVFQDEPGAPAEKSVVTELRDGPGNDDEPRGPGPRNGGPGLRLVK